MGRSEMERSSTFASPSRVPELGDGRATIARFVQGLRSIGVTPAFPNISGGGLAYVLRKAVE